MSESLDPLAFDPDRMATACLRWLEAQEEEDLPILFLSGGPPSRDARFHYLARRPRMRLRSQGELLDPASPIEVLDGEGRVCERIPTEALPGFLESWDRGQGEGGIPSAPCFFGWVGYDYAWANEYGLPRIIPAGSERLPVIHLALYDEVLVLDRVEACFHGPGEAYEELLAMAQGDPSPPGPLQLVSPPETDLGEGAYQEAVARIRHHCLVGDLFQADLSRRIQCRVQESAVSVFSRLAGASPAPFSAFLSCGEGRAVLSSSPEEYLRFQGREILSLPIKGTGARGKDPEEDERRRARLLHSEKDLAELGMIVDLIRNDVGRHAKAGSVQVRGFPSLLELPHVFHLFAEVRAEREEGRSPWEILLSAFPPGSIVGAPKPKALEILEGLEKSRRGVYTGCIGWMDTSLQGRWSVAIRTLGYEDGTLRFGVGGGVTALSDPVAEWEETGDKALGFARTLGWEGAL